MKTVTVFHAHKNKFGNIQKSLKIEVIATMVVTLRLLQSLADFSDKTINSHYWQY